MAPDSSAGCAVCGAGYKGHTKALTGHVYEKAPPIPFVIPEGWKRQFMSYVYARWQHGLQRPTDPFLLAVVHIIRPVLQCWELRFTQGELETHWGWMVDRHSTLDGMRATQDLQPFMHNMDYECGQGTDTPCRYLLTCELAASLRGGRVG